MEVCLTRVDEMLSHQYPDQIHLGWDKNFCSSYMYVNFAVLTYNLTALANCSALLRALIKTQSPEYKTYSSKLHEQRVSHIVGCQDIRDIKR